MFEILKKKDAKVEEMAEAYVAIEEHSKALEEERQAVHADLISFKLDGCTTGDLTDFKERYTDLGLDLEAAQSALATLFDHMGKTMPLELEQRRTDARAKIRALQMEGNVQFDEALKKLAEYYVIREDLTGDRWNVSDWNSLRNQFGARWTDERRIQLGQLITRKKEEFPERPNIARQIRNLQDEIRQIDGILLPWQPDKAINALLEHHRSA